ncbi:MAG: S-methyl-5-thioribose-1-phosphate isomerase [Chloroflexi bacterium]|nr:S-methyl-5-thioribose-1-phosphate isomerase [Chloroflexota bacterium]
MSAIQWSGERLKLLDQTRLPGQIVYLEADTYVQVVQAIKDMRVRGAPLIGIAGAYALAMAARDLRLRDPSAPQQRLHQIANQIVSARPTAANLSRAVERVLAATARAASLLEAEELAVREASLIHTEEEQASLALGCLGAALVPAGATVLTHCNTGSLATAGIGTALGAIREAWRQGRLKRVVVTETRPLLQGARLTAWELAQEGIPVTLIVDSAAGDMMRRGDIHCVMVGADRIAVNGDVANKIGTYTLAVLAAENRVPFYVAAPTSTVDLTIESGEHMPIEMRAPEEVTWLSGVQVAPTGVDAINMAFDVTPARYITAIITDRGVLHPPYGEALKTLLGDAEKPVSSAAYQTTG